MASCAPIAMPAPDGEAPDGRLQIGTASSATKRKNRPAGTPDPEAEVVSLSPRTLLEPCRYVCEICNQVFRREQNLLLHRRRHNLPWKFKKRDAAAAPRKKRVFVCPEPSCPRHHPSHALADLTGIRKHFRRKHGACRQWACTRCSKAYAVLTDYNAHVKTCGTRAGHSCCQDCGRVFNRVDRLMEHRDTCSAGRPQAGVGADVSSEPACGVTAAGSSLTEQLVPTARSPSRSSPSSVAVAVRNPAAPTFFHEFLDQAPTPLSDARGRELQLMPPSCYAAATHSPQAPISRTDNDVTTELRLSIGFCSGDNRGREFRPSSFTGHVVEPCAQARR